MLNKVILMGRFTKDPELKSTQSGTSVVSFSIACDRDFVGQNGERETDFINCVAWKGTAEFICKYFRKGSLAAIEGRIETRSWDTPEGKKGYATEVNVSNIYFAESKKDASEVVADPYEAIPVGDESDLPF